MDDLYAFTGNLDQARNLRRELRAVSATDGFNLTKRTSNNLEFIQSILESDRSNSAPVETITKVFDKDVCVKWNPNDYYQLLQHTNFKDTPKSKHKVRS